ncbi:MAG: hypothetical protein HUJ87_12215 [Fusobacterium varium]|uniref:hypothetical protein n=1 Tax=Fusobacterium varium TaxID=856 RepID=UPI0024314CFF|nr:hypothetical protein [Fusobacterium varium]MCF0171249.1 hypothetical protein [Fusobacterium varium]
MKKVVLIIFSILILMSCGKEPIYEFQYRDGAKVLYDVANDKLVTGTIETTKVNYDGTTYIAERAEYKNGVYHGKVKIYSQTNKLLEEIEYKNGVKHGKQKGFGGKFKIESEYKEGKLNGKFEGIDRVSVSRNSNLYSDYGTGEYKNGIKIGTWKLYVERNNKLILAQVDEYDGNGKQLKKIQYNIFTGKKESLVIFNGKNREELTYYENEKIETKIIYGGKNHKVLKEIKYDKNGILIAEINFDEELGEKKEEIKYYDTKEIKAKITYDTWTRNKIKEEEYYKNKKLKKRIDYDKDISENEYDKANIKEIFEYTEEGVLVKCVKYKNGKQYEIKEYYVNGKIKSQESRLGINDERMIVKEYNEQGDIIKEGLIEVGGRKIDFDNINIKEEKSEVIAKVKEKKSLNYLLDYYKDKYFIYELYLKDKNYEIEYENQGTQYVMTCKIEIGKLTNDKDYLELLPKLVRSFYIKDIVYISTHIISERDEAIMVCVSHKNRRLTRFYWTKQEGYYKVPSHGYIEEVDEDEIKFMDKIIEFVIKINDYSIENAEKIKIGKIIDQNK